MRRIRPSSGAALSSAATNLRRHAGQMRSGQACLRQADGRIPGADRADAPEPEPRPRALTGPHRQSLRVEPVAGFTRLTLTAWRRGRTSRIDSPVPERAVVGIGDIAMNPIRNPIRAFVFAAGAALLLAPSFAAPAFAQGNASGQKPPSPEQSLTEKMNAYVGCINRLSERSYEFTQALFQLGRAERPHRKRADHLRHLHDLRHGRLQKERREGQCARAARRRARSRGLRLCRGREQARAAAERSRRLLFAGELQGRPDGQGQGPASASRRRVGRVRGRRQGAARPASKPSTTSARSSASPRSSRRKAARRAITCRRR